MNNNTKARWKALTKSQRSEMGRAKRKSTQAKVGQPRRSL